MPNPTSQPMSEKETQIRRRLLACSSCQQRKVKCDRKSPCAACVKSGTHCVAPSGPRRRRPRFPERELLNRLRQFEELLRRHKIDFTALHPSVTLPSVTAGLVSSTDDGNDEPGQPSPPEVDDDGNDHLLFGPCPPAGDLPALHSEQSQVFRMWQIYLENVSPLLRVTHSPTLQARIIDAASQGERINPAFEALVLSICCMSIMSLSDDKCRSLFGSSRRELLESYQPACRQALRRCRFWRCENLDALVASYLYLVSVRPQSDPRSIAPAISTVLRTAQRMGLHDESINSGYDALEAEMRRRLWWSLVVFDQRICEMTEYGTTTLIPTWDCKRPANASDFEMQSGSIVSSAVHGRPTEALFVVVLSEMADSIRHSSFHLDFVNPALKALAHPKSEKNNLHRMQGHSTFMSLEKDIEGRYLARCDLNQPLHFMTVWTARGYMARHRLLEHYSRHAINPSQQTETQRLTALAHAVKMLECDTKLRTSRLTQGFLWLVDFCVPILAYFYILHHLRRRPAETQSDEAWRVMSENWEARAALRAIMPRSEAKGAFSIFSRLVLEAWGAYENTHREKKEMMTPPLLVSDIRDRLQQKNQMMGQGQMDNGRHVNSAGVVDVNIMNIDTNNSNKSSLLAAQEDFALISGSSGGGGDGGQDPSESYRGESSDLAGNVLIDIDMDDFWTTMDWSLMHAQGW
ncbi:hypothetical protein M406DRAFT_338708 [Cryphonectria parasitica EP155]|uniref:Zn(2)-C6 fungal-type domain-containing protein n=1 Tax=Cryphonectria parasitica (strain ATCC 38755 / EP155) TaxID=660469 RepID=A0A9P4Y7P6_CRYP1|nr:uncharacterized protein M406DRAFT_338708 [Cryphonectria parasitica EP155]KAF3768068.1 hypothetical protein M406DRAFT_338708 [Cryphonectria parasitica EP155]